jgi:hypothetical protein
MKVMLAIVIFISALCPSLGKDTYRNLSLSDHHDNDVDTDLPTLGLNTEPRVAVASTTITTFNDTKTSSEEEERALAHRCKLFI